MKKVLLVILGMFVVGCIWGYVELKTTPADDDIQAKIRLIVDREPRLKSQYDQALSDGKLTTMEAWDIVSKANELKGK